MFELTVPDLYSSHIDPNDFPEPEKYKPSTVADLHSKILDARPPLGAQILSISCSFWENLTKTYVGAPPGELAPPPRGNPRSATAQGSLMWMES